MHVCRSNVLDEVPKLLTFAAIGERHQGDELGRWCHHIPLIDDVLVLSNLAFLLLCQRDVVHVDIDVKRVTIVVTWNCYLTMIFYKNTNKGEGHGSYSYRT